MGLRAWGFPFAHGEDDRAHERAIDSDLAALDLSDLDRRFATIEAEHEGELTALVLARVQQIGRRGAPLREVTSAPVQGTARLEFGDRSTLIVRGDEPGELGRLAVMILNHRTVRLLGWRRHDDGIRIRLGRDRGAPFECTAVGLDQRD